jgi:hypothetical protein
MKKLKLNAYTLVGLYVFLLAACSGKKQSPEHVRYIPADAQFVLAMDARRIISKSLQPQELFSESNLKEMGASDKEAKQVSERAERILNSGIDYVNTVYVFGQTEGEIVAALLALDAPDKWNKNIQDPAFWKKVFDKEAVPALQKKGKVKYFVQEKDCDRLVVAWDERVLLVGNIHVGCSETEKANIAQAQLLNLFALPKEKQLFEKQESFKKALEEGEDVVFWADLNAIDKLDAFDNVDASARKYLKGASFTLNVRFDDGLIQADAAFLPSKESLREMQLYYNKKIKKEVLKIPYQKPVALLSFAIAEAALDQMVENQALKDINTNLVKEIGLTADELIEMWDGQFTLALNSFSGLPELALVLGVRNNDLYNKMMAYTTRKGFFTKKPNAQGEVYLLMGGVAHLYKDGNYLRIASGASESIWKSADTPEVWTSQIQKSSSFIGIRAELLEQLAKSRLLNNDEANEVINLAEELVMWSPGYEDGKVKGQMRLTFREKDKSALLILIDAAKTMAKKAKKYDEDEPLARGMLPMEEVDEEAFEEEPVF